MPPFGAAAALVVGSTVGRKLLKVLNGQMGFGKMGGGIAGRTLAQEEFMSRSIIFLFAFAFVCAGLPTATALNAAGVDADSLALKPLDFIAGGWAGEAKLGGKKYTLLVNIDDKRIRLFAFDSKGKKDTKIYPYKIKNNSVTVGDDGAKGVLLIKWDGKTYERAFVRKDDALSFAKGIGPFGALKLGHIRALKPG